MPEQDHRETLESMRDRLLADLRPVRPLQSERLCLGTASVFILTSFALLSGFLGLRPDQEILGKLLWGPSILEILVALTALRLAMGQSLPGRSPSAIAVWVAAGAGLTCHVATTLMVSARSLTEIPAGSSLRIGLRDFGFELCLGIPMVLVAFWIAQRGFTARTSLVGLMAGLGAALAADAVWRLFCPIAEVGHVFVSHTLALAFVVLMSWCLADWWRQRMLNRRSVP